MEYKAKKRISKRILYLMEYHEACHGSFLQRAVDLVKMQQAAAFELTVEPLAKISRTSCVNGQE